MYFACMLIYFSSMLTCFASILIYFDSMPILCSIHLVDKLVVVTLLGPGGYGGGPGLQVRCRVNVTPGLLQHGQVDVVVAGGAGDSSDDFSCSNLCRGEDEEIFV